MQTLTDIAAALADLEARARKLSEQPATAEPVTKTRKPYPKNRKRGKRKYPKKRRRKAAPKKPQTSRPQPRRPRPVTRPTAAMLINELDEPTFNALVCRGSAVSKDGKWLITRVTDKFDHFTYTVTPNSSAHL